MADDKKESKWQRAMQGIGLALSGFSAPFLGDTTWLSRQQSLNKEEVPTPTERMLYAAFNKLGIPIDSPAPTSGGQPTMPEQPMQTPPENWRAGLRGSLSEMPPEASIDDVLVKKQLGYSTNPMLRRELATEAARERIKGSVDVATSGEKSAMKELQDKYGEAGRVVQAFRNLMGFGALMDQLGMQPFTRQTISNFGGKSTYLPDSIQNKITPILNYAAQETEVRLGLLPILSGQARYVVDLARAISKTVPSAGFSTKNRKNLIAQSVRNSMSLVYGVQNGQLTAKRLTEFGIDPEGYVKSSEGKLPDEAQSLLKSIKLTDEQEKAIEDAVDYVISAKPISEGKIQKDESIKPMSTEELLKKLGM